MKTKKGADNLNHTARGVPTNFLHAQQRAQHFLAELYRDINAYHNHKERMAYAGMALYLGTFGTLLVKDWVPSWYGCQPLIVRLGLITLPWYFFLRFIKWQLSLRRWAAIRVAGIQRLMALWVTKPPCGAQLEPWSKKPDKRGKFSRWLISVSDHVFPNKLATIEPDVSEDAFPSALVEEWKRQREEGTKAMNHERLLISIAWLLYASVLLVRVFLASGSSCQ